MPLMRKGEETNHLKIRLKRNVMSPIKEKTTGNRMVITGEFRIDRNPIKADI